MYASERLNTAAHARWRAFATQDYFDRRGVFVGVLWAGPLILVLCAMLVGFLARAARLLVRRAAARAARRCLSAHAAQVKVKRAQLRSRAKAEAAGGDVGGDDETVVAAAGAAATAPRRRAGRRDE